MSSLKFQKLVESDRPGYYKSGSAAIISTTYDASVKGSGHCKHAVIERLGKVIWLSENRKEGIFLSDTRGLVEYNLITDTFSEVGADDKRIQGTQINPQLITHTTLGDVYYCLAIINKTGLKGVLLQIFKDQKTLERVLCHLLHTIIRNCARISCSDFVSQSSLSYSIEEVSIGTLDRDASFFERMGNFDWKLQFFKCYIDYMRRSTPEFGKACYVDSTPLPNDVKDNPFNAFSTHGTGGTEKQTRLVLLLDILTNKPVWFDFITGNTLDHSTLEQVYEQVRMHLDIEITGGVLDAGYACTELFKRFNIDNRLYIDNNEQKERFMITRMPDKPGYPYGDCYQAVKDIFQKGQYHFVRGEHTYFGMQFGPYTICGYPEYVYTYVDIQQALSLNQQYRSNSPGEWEKLTPEEKDWLTIKDGFFNLIANKEDTPDNILDEYLDRASIEHIFKTPKEYLGLLPCRHWTIERIKGKVLCDVISTVLFLEIRKTANSLGITMSRLLRSLATIEASLDTENEMLVISTLNRQIKNIFETSGIFIPNHLKLKDWHDMVHKEYLLTVPSIESRPKTAGRPKGSKNTKPKNKVPESQEQKNTRKAEREREKEATRQENKNLKAIKKSSSKACTEATKVIMMASKGSIKCSQNALGRSKKVLEEAKEICELLSEKTEAMIEIKRAEEEISKAESVLNNIIGNIY